MSSSSSASSSSQTLRIFSPAEWHTLYSDEDYQKKERVQLYLPHFLIAKNQPETTVIASINSVKKEKLVAHDPKNHGLTPLIIAAMKGNERVVEELLKQDLVKQKIDDTDEYGWTALHHAALSSDAIFQKLIGAGANPNRLTNLRGTPADLQALTNPGIRDDSMKSVFFEGKPLTQEIAQKTFGLTYRDTAFYPPECLKELWRQKPQAEEPVANYAIEHPARRFPKVEIVAIDKEKGFYGLVAGEDIPAGALFGEYGGVFGKENLESGWAPFSPENGKKNAYVFGGFDGRVVGNATRFINSGFSNVGSFSMAQNGMTKFIFLNEKPIQKGEPLLFNYGEHAHELTYGQQTLFNREKIHAFFKDGLEAIKKEISSAEEKVKLSRYVEAAGPAYLHRMDVRDHSTFPLDNPACLIDLHASGIVSAAKWIPPIACVDKLLVKEWLLSRGLVSHARVLALALHLAGLDRAMEKKKPGSSALLRNWLKEHCQAYKVVDLVKAMEWIAEDPTCVDKIDERLKSYDWTKDKSNLYSYENRRAALEQKLNFDLSPGLTNHQFVSTLPQQRRRQLQNIRQIALAEGDGFVGSELEKMLNQIEANMPNDPDEVLEYLTKRLSPDVTEIINY